MFTLTGRIGVLGMGIRLSLKILFRKKELQFVASKYFMNDARAAWVAVEPQKRIGLKLFFPTVVSCQQCYNYLTGDVNVTVINCNPKGSKELVILPHQTPQETIEEILVDLYKNENSNYTLLRRKYERQKIIVEFGSPNIAKPLHMGHLRSAVTGHFVARIHKALGHDVSSFCFLGDWGTQFGLLQAGLSRWHTGSSVLESVNSMNLKELLEYYIRATKEQETNSEFASESRNFCAQLEEGNPDAVAVWKAIRTKTVEHLDSVWIELGIRYDVIQGESDYTMKSVHTDKSVLLLQELDVLQTSPEGVKYAQVTIGEKAKQKSKVTLVKSDGSSLYILRDISAAIHRKQEYGFDRMIYVVDRSQTHHFLALFDILRQIEINEPSKVPHEHLPMFHHVTFGRVEGQSTRAGTFSLLSDVIRDGQDLMQVARASSPNTRYRDDMEIAKALAISSLIVHSLKVKRNRDVEFDWTEALKSHGDTGVSLQYAHARLVSLIRKQGGEFIGENGEMKHGIDYEYILSDPIALNLMLRLVNFEDALWASYNELEPCILIHYLFRLRDASSKALKELSVKNEEDVTIASTRIFLFVLSKNIMSYGMSILGIQSLEQM